VSRDRFRGRRERDQPALVACLVVIGALCGALLATGMRRASGTRPREVRPEPAVASRRRPWRAAAFDRSVSVIAAAATVITVITAITGQATGPLPVPDSATAVSGGTSQGRSASPTHPGGTANVYMKVVSGMPFCLAGKPCYEIESRPGGRS
jgi:hypothetical protein